MVPANNNGNQIAHNGHGYAGFFAIVNLPTFPNIREYLQVPLTATLSAGQTYQVSFYVSLADQADYAVSTIGAYFSATAQAMPTNTTGATTPQIINGATNILSDKANWTLITGTFTATGNEQFLTIANFATGANSHATFVGPATTSSSYYYVDDVSVSVAAASCQASFTSTGSTTICLPSGSILFTNTSSPSNATLQWIFNGGTPSSSIAQSPTISYSSPGNYDVILIATDSLGTCTDTLFMNSYVHVISCFVDFTVAPSTSVCDSVPVDFCLMDSVWLVATNISWTVTNPGGGTYNSVPCLSHTFFSPGAYTVCVNATFPGGTPAAKCTTIIVSSCLGILELSSKELNIFPNPTSAQTQIHFFSNTNSNLQISLINIFGEIVFVENRDAKAGENNFQLDVSSFPRGIYFLQMKDECKFYSTILAVQ